MRMKSLEHYGRRPNRTARLDKAPASDLFADESAIQRFPYVRSEFLNF